MLERREVKESFSGLPSAVVPVFLIYPFVSAA
jgi:hypothetical protein